ncbi:MAG: hypothetical protein OSW77_10455, partial [Proteobacteria bacterium]|nr:hypothetical protein [Pseudomonadota bacterium]
MGNWTGRLIESFARGLLMASLTLCSATMAHAEPLASDKNLIVDPPVPSSGDRVGVTAYYHNDGPLVPKSVRYEE